MADRQQIHVVRETAIEGGSNGGLTVGAVITQRPDLFSRAICQVPLLDMVRYQKFLIARYWMPEYGKSDKPDDFSLDSALLAATKTCALA
jgi:prolyl oligopeptidase PreP (S9A serine peptidase family)